MLYEYQKFFRVMFNNSGCDMQESVDYTDTTLVLVNTKSAQYMVP